MSTCLNGCITSAKYPRVLLAIFVWTCIQLALFSTYKLYNQIRLSKTKSTETKALHLPEFNTTLKVLTVDHNVTADNHSHPSSTHSTAAPSPGDFIHYGSEDFQYPLLVDMPDIVDKVKKGKTISVKPVNKPNFPFVIRNANKCRANLSQSQTIELLILIKSAPANSLARQVIRDTWGNENCWGGRIVRHNFLLGRAPLGEHHDILESLIEREATLYEDVVQQDFIDHYFNNTYKMMMGFKWALEYCSRAKNILFVDDDYFVHPRAVTAYLKSMSKAMQDRLVSGYIYRSSYPVRTKDAPSGKWVISYHEYPWSVYPRYVTAGAFFVSMGLVRDLYIAMHYTRYLRFDDVFLGIIMHKLSISPTHLSQVHSFIRADPKSASFPSMLASHGYKEPREILQTWQQLRCSQFCVDATS